MILMSSFAIICFFGAWSTGSFLTQNSVFISPIIFGLKVSCVLFFYIWVRASFPRYRIDQLMRLC
jgi:NADH-quinone oxidoreductase subunit H